MIKQVQLKDQPARKINKFCKLLDRLNNDVTKKVKDSHRRGFNPRINRDSGRLVGFTCRDCGKEYRTWGWVKRHHHSKPQSNI